MPVEWEFYLFGDELKFFFGGERDKLFRDSLTIFAAVCRFFLGDSLDAIGRWRGGDDVPSLRDGEPNRFKGLEDRLTFLAVAKSDCFLSCIGARLAGTI